MKTEIDQAFVNALFDQVRLLKEENKNLHREIDLLKEDIQNLEDNLFYLNPSLLDDSTH